VALPASEENAPAESQYILPLEVEQEGPVRVLLGRLGNATINGKAYPQTDTIHMKVGQTVKLRFTGSNNNFVHPILEVAA
jgi:FtsP/CotA-like multicopper oxidase with cupredoxin domain